VSRPYQVIDSDGHVIEPMHIWKDYIDPKFRSRTPEMVIGDQGHEQLVLEGKLLAGEKSAFGAAGHIGLSHEKQEWKSLHFAEGRRGGFDPHARIADLDLDGIDAVFLYSTVAGMLAARDDLDLAAAHCRAYNRWLADYCSAYPDRLFPVALLPMRSLERALDEMKFVRRELGMRAAVVRPNPYNGKMISHRDYDPFWATAQDLDMAIAFHEGGGDARSPPVGIDRFEGKGARHIVAHTMEMMLVAVSVLWDGVCERFPKIRIGFMESGGGWIAPWLDRMDRHFEQSLYRDASVTVRPSELFQRNCWISFEPVEKSLAVLADYIGPNKILWATDYPHPDGYFPGAPAMIEAMGLPEETRRAVLAQGAMEFYGLGA
jgi:predicted TIM-barrel fold metal-dependent hydrolase